VVTSSGALYSWGWSEFGQLGHGTDGSFNQSASSIKITFEAEKDPRQVQGFTKKVRLVGC
jgi:alpha-tubulin suppressor-like RCC1 family protein